MKYRIPHWHAVHGDVIPLLYAAETMARAKATGYGELPIHGEVLRNFREGFMESLAREADAGRLQVCDSRGFAGTTDEIVAWWTGNEQMIGEHGNPIPLAREVAAQIALHVNIADLNSWGAKQNDSYELVRMSTPCMHYRPTNPDGIETDQEEMRTIAGWPFDQADKEGFAYSENEPNARPSDQHEGTEHKQSQEEPPMKVGTNSRKKCEAWVAWMAFRVEGETREERAQEIKKIAHDRRYRMQKGAEFSMSLIVRSIAAKTTGTRQDNRDGGKRARN